MDEQMQQQIVLLVQAAMQGDQLAQQQIQQIMQAAQQGDQQAAEIAQMIQAIVQQMQGQKARFGAKLNYIKFLRGRCPEGYEMQYFKTGGCMKCKKKEEGGEVVSAKEGDPVSEFKCGRKMKKKAKGGNVDKAKCGKKVVKDQYPAIPLEPGNKYLQRGGGLWNIGNYVSRWSGKPTIDVELDNGDYLGYDLPAYGDPGEASGVYANDSDMDEIQATWRLRDALRPAPIDRSIKGAPSSRKQPYKKAEGGVVNQSNTKKPQQKPQSNLSKGKSGWTSDGPTDGSGEAFYYKDPKTGKGYSVVKNGNNEFVHNGKTYTKDAFNRYALKNGLPMFNNGGTLDIFAPYRNLKLKK